MVHVHQIPRRSGSHKLSLQPERLRGKTGNSIWFTKVAVKDEEVHGTPDEIVITFIAWQGEVIDIRLECARVPVVVAWRGEEAVEGRAGAIGTCIWIDELVVILPDILIDRGCFAKRIIVIAGCNDQIGVPA